METREQKKRSLRLTLLLLLLTAILLIMSSYAWFTANQTVKIEELQVNVAAQNGLQISADGTTWSAILNTSDLKAVANNTTLINQIPAELVPVSTAGSVNAGFMDMYLGTVQANEASGKDELTAEKSTEKTGSEGHFIAFDMFLKVEAATDIALAANSNVRAINGETSKGIENAARVAFLVEGNVATGTDLATIQGLRGATTSTRYIWEPNYDVHTAPAVMHANSTYGITTQQTGAAQIAYDGINAEIETGILLANTNKTSNATYFATTPIDYKTTASFGTNDTDQQQIFSLQAGITKVRVYMWIEGQDVDCENTASGSNIAYNIQITRLDSTP